MTTAETAGSIDRPRDSLITSLGGCVCETTSAAGWPACVRDRHVDQM